MTTEEFNSTPIVIGENPTTYGEMRAMSQRTIDRTQEEWIGVLTTDPLLIVNALRGAVAANQHLLNVIEQLTNEREEAQK